MVKDREERIGALVQLGEYIAGFDERLEAHMKRAEHNNPWFTLANQHHALQEIATHFLDRGKLTSWLEDYESPESTRNVGIIAAGNIPLVAFHDVLCSFVAGHTTQIKLSDRDKYLLPFIVKKLDEILPGTASRIMFVERLKGFDAVIATGSNNSARYFEQYFGKYPNIIRKNRNGVAVISGDESVDDLEGIADDVFMYFGLGCRNVSHIKVPNGYDLEKLKAGFEKYAGVADHNKFKNNFDYNLAICILNQDVHTDLGNIVVIPSESLISPVGCLYYSEYSSIKDVSRELMQKQNDIQCVVSHASIPSVTTVPPGMAQRPELADYADGVDTMRFLTTLA